MRALLLLPVLCCWIAATAESHGARPVISGVEAVEPAENGSVTLKATVDPGKELTQVSFRYGLTASYGSSIKATPVPADSDPREVTVRVTGLVGGKTYHFQVVAQNASTGSKPERSADHTFDTEPYAPRVVLLDPTGIRGGSATLNGQVTPNRDGGTVTVYFRYGKVRGTYELGRIGEREISGDAIDERITTQLNGLDRSTTYYYQLVVEYGGSAPATSSEGVLVLANNQPTAAEDERIFDGRSPLVIDVLSNDKDPDRDEIYIKSTTQPAKGTVTVARGRKALTYTPGANFDGADEFSYTVEDGQGGSATATVKLRSPRVAVSGLFGSLIQNRNGKSAGYLRVQTSRTGAFSGKVYLDGKSYTLRGTFDVNGRFRGKAHGDDGSIDVEFSVDEESGSTLVATLDGGEWRSQINTAAEEPISISELEGRYTVSFANGSSGSEGSTTAGDQLPGGAGWAQLEVNDDGSVRIVGKLGDGRSYSASSVVMAGPNGPEVVIYATPESSEVVGTLQLGDTISGTLAWVRKESDATFYGDGFDTVVSATGARYLPPDNGRRALETGEDEVSNVVVTLTGGNLPRTLSTRVRVSEEDNVDVLGNNLEELELEIDRRDGTFRGGFHHPEDGSWRKVSGVLLQSDGSARGVFFGLDRTGTVQFRAATENSPGNGAPPPPAPLPTTPSLPPTFSPFFPE